MEFVTLGAIQFSSKAYFWARMIACMVVLCWSLFAVAEDDKKKAEAIAANEVYLQEIVPLWSSIAWTAMILLI